MIDDKIKQSIRKEAKSFFKNASGCHDWTHVERVVKLANIIGKEEGADLDVLEIAVLLHDIGRKKEIKSKGKLCHAEEGVVLAKDILKKYNLNEDVVDNILHCIISHRYRNNHIPNTIEAKALYDADKLDSIGAIGIARDFLFAGNAGSNCLYTGNENKILKEGYNHSYTKEDSAIIEYEFKLKKIKNNIITKTGKKFAKERHLFMKDYFKRFWREVGGEL